MAGEFLRKKWETYFEANDLDKDGIMTLEDANVFAERFIKHHGLQGERARQFKFTPQAFWKSNFLFGREKIDRKTYMELMEKDYTGNREAFIQRISRAQEVICDTLDVDNDGLLTKEEYLIACSFWGIENPARDALQLFTQMKPGFVDKKAFNDSWIALMTNDDANKADVEKPAMYILRMIDHV